MHSTEASLAIGIDFGGTSVKSALIRGSEILRRGDTIDPQAPGGSAATIDAMEKVIRALSEGLPRVAPVGIGLPGLVDSTNGIVHGLSNVSDWKEVALKAILSDRLKTTVILENDANAMAYGEWKFGAAAQTRHALCLTLGTGVGGGLILDGKLYRGAQLAAGELGHSTIDYRGPKGPYGNAGCLEQYVGNRQIAARALAAYALANATPPAVPCTPEVLARAAQNGCPVARDLWEAIGDELGAAISSAVWILNPDAVVIGGGISKAGDLIFEPIRRSVCSRTAKVINEHLRIIPAALGNDAGAIGCAALALEASI